MNKIFTNSNEKENRNEKNNKKHFNFDLYKKNTINSLNDIEYFLNNFNHFFKYLKLYKLIRK